MQRIIDSKKTADYIEKSRFESIFSFPVRPHTQLFLAEADDYIVREGVQPEYLYYMVTGRAKLYLTNPNGKITLLDFFDAPCFIGEMELMHVKEQPRAVQALVPCHCLALPVETCREALLGDARFLRHLCMYLGVKNGRTVEALSRSQAYPLQNRLASFILLAAPDGTYRENHTQAAEYLGVSYRHLLYVMADFVKAGYLDKGRGGYRIANKPALLRLAREIDPGFS